MTVCHFVMKGCVTHLAGENRVTHSNHLKIYYGAVRISYNLHPQSVDEMQRTNQMQGRVRSSVSGWPLSHSFTDACLCDMLFELGYLVWF